MMQTVDILDRDCRIIDQNAHSQCEATQCHEIERLSGNRENGDGRQDSEWDGDCHNQRGTPACQKGEDHGGSQQTGNHGFRRHALDGSLYKQGLIEQFVNLHARRRCGA